MQKQLLIPAAKYFHLLNPLQYKKNLDWFNLRQIADNNLKYI